ncbi:MAG: PTS sugar transporter subunit IIA [Coriobacteriales bacterium]|nr:PTS sugar transporter subunit IIA [Coriobacteriales bacterium]
MLLKKELIKVGLEPADTEEALKAVAQGFVDYGYAKPSFPQAVVDREIVFATGLPGAGMDVALPHSDSIHVNETSIAIATVKTPVKFKMMGSQEIAVYPKILFMLAVHEAHAQLSMLQQLMDILQERELLQACFACTTPDEVYDLMADKIG